MKIGITNIEIDISSPLFNPQDSSLLIGFSTTEGFTECCDDPVVIFEIGILVAKLTIIASRNHKH
jgi:hypothetical protein